MFTYVFLKLYPLFHILGFLEVFLYLSPSFFIVVWVLFMCKVYLPIHPSTYPRFGHGGSRPARVFQTSILSYTFHLLLGGPQGATRQAGLCNSSSKSCSYLEAFTQKNVAGTPLKGGVLEASRSGARTTSVVTLLTIFLWRNPAILWSS